MITHKKMTTGLISAYRIVSRLLIDWFPQDIKEAVSFQVDS